MDRYKRLTEKINDQFLKQRELKMDVWQEYVLFSWHWWLGLALAVIPLLIWMRYRDRGSTTSLLLAGLTTSILSAFWDTTGNFFGWYDYRYDLLPMTTNYFPYYFVLLPVLVMFTIQLFKGVNVYLKGIVLSALISFVGLPVLRMIGIYQLLNWNYVYSFILMCIIFVLSFQMSKIKDQKDHGDVH
ncbi:CBO0543 family protein [Rossellomorea sp. AcN35-11]|nr:hypothetical protein [Rossellomorea aquimaris]WJV30922.1 CBO0543 family protein [Rossellomorea sp. AcN35-11]